MTAALISGKLLHKQGGLLGPIKRPLPENLRVPLGSDGKLDK